MAQLGSADRRDSVRGLSATKREVGLQSVVGVRCDRFSPNRCRVRTSSSYWKLYSVGARSIRRTQIGCLQRCRF